MRHRGCISMSRVCCLQIASGGNDHSVRLWRCKSRLWRLECVLGSHPGPVTSATFAQSGEWLASGSHRTHTGQRYGVVKVRRLLLPACCCLHGAHMVLLSWCTAHTRMQSLLSYTWGTRAVACCANAMCAMFAYLTHRRCGTCRP